MASRAEDLAKQFEAKANEATAVLERLSDADWKKVTTAEKWPVGVTAHHIAVSHELIAGIIKTLAAHKQGAAAAATVVRGLSDAQLDRTGAVLAGVPPMSAAQLAGGLLVGHVDEHLGSIRATVGA